MSRPGKKGETINEIRKVDSPLSSFTSPLPIKPLSLHLLHQRSFAVPLPLATAFPSNSSSSSADMI